MAKLTFIAEFSVDESWVVDGFNPNDDDALEMLNHRLSMAYGHELKARILKPIDQEKAAKLMGYKDAKEMHKVYRKEGRQIPRSREFGGTFVRLNLRSAGRPSNKIIPGTPKP